MKTAYLLSTALLLAATALPLSAAGDGWVEDFATAKKTAAKEKKDILIDFTGSDWCGWCIKLQEEVFSKDAFKNVAPNDFVLVELDFPQKPENVEKQDEAIKKQNEELSEKFGIEGFPSIVLTDSSGRPYAKTGYQAGGPEAYLTHLAELQGARKNRDEALAKAAKLEGMDKANALKEALAPIDQNLQIAFYREEIDSIIAADKEDTLGYAKLLKDKEEENAFKEKIKELRPLIEDKLKNEDFAGAIAGVDTWIEASKFEGSLLQQAQLIKLGFYGAMQDHAGAMKLVDEVIKIDPESDQSKQLEQLKPRIQAAIEEAKKVEEKAPEGEKEAVAPAKEGE